MVFQGGVSLWLVRSRYARMEADRAVVEAWMRLCTKSEGVYAAAWIGRFRWKSVGWSDSILR